MSCCISRLCSCSLGRGCRASASRPLVARVGGGGWRYEKRESVRGFDMRSCLVPCQRSMRSSSPTECGAMRLTRAARCWGGRSLTGCLAGLLIATAAVVAAATAVEADDDDAERQSSGQGYSESAHRSRFLERNCQFARAVCVRPQVGGRAALVPMGGGLYAERCFGCSRLSGHSLVPLGLEVSQAWRCHRVGPAESPNER